MTIASEVSRLSPWLKAGCLLFMGSVFLRSSPDRISPTETPEPILQSLRTTLPAFAAPAERVQVHYTELEAGEDLERREELLPWGNGVMRRVNRVTALGSDVLVRRQSRSNFWGPVMLASMWREAGFVQRVLFSHSGWEIYRLEAIEDIQSDNFPEQAGSRFSARLRYGKPVWVDEPAGPSITHQFSCGRGESVKAWTVVPETPGTAHVLRCRDEATHPVTGVAMRTDLQYAWLTGHNLLLPLNTVTTYQPPKGEPEVLQVLSRVDSASLID